MPIATSAAADSEPSGERLEPVEAPLKLNPRAPEGVVVRAERGGAAYSPDGRAGVTIEPRVIGGDTRIAVNRVPMHELPKGRRLIGGVYDFSATHASSDARITAFAKGVTISLTYRLEELAGTPESSLSIYHFNERASFWEPIPSKLDRQGRVLTATVNHFSQYSIQGAPVDPNEPSFGSVANYGFDTPGYTVAGGPENANFDTSAYVVPGGPENANFDTPGYLATVQPTNQDFETGDLTGWTLTGSGGVRVDSNGYDDSYYAYVIPNSSITSDLLTFSTDSQTLKFWANSAWDAYYELIRESDGAVLQSAYLNTSGTWRYYSRNISSYRGIPLKIRFRSWTASELRVDQITLRCNVPNWEVAGTDQFNIVSQGGPSGSYVDLVAPGGAATCSVTSSPFTIPNDAQTIHFWAYNGGYGHALLLDASNDQQLLDYGFDAGATWQQYFFNVSSYRGRSVKLRFSSYGVRVDQITMVRDIPYWETTWKQPIIASGDGPFGPYAKVGQYASITSSPFNIPEDTQTIHFWSYCDGGARAIINDANTGQELVNYSYGTGSSWREQYFNVTSYRGRTVKLTFYASSSSEIRVDNAILMRDIPNWETTWNQPVIASDDGPFGPYARVGQYASITSSPLIISDDAQSIHFWSLCDGGARAIIKDVSTGQELVNYLYGTNRSWQQLAVNVTGARGRTVKLIFSASSSADLRVDNVRLDSSDSQLGSSPNTCQTGEPVNTTTGNYVYGHEDISIPGRGLGLTLSRSYNSMGTAIGLFGDRWSFNYGMSLAVNADNSVTVAYPDGRRVVYTRNADGSYKRPVGVYDSLVRNADASYTLTTKSQARFSFSPDGKLASIQDKNGNTLSLAYSGGTLRSVTDPSGRALTFSYGAAGESQVAATPTAVLAFPNADFEQGSYTNWTTTGTAFGSNPTNYNDAGKQGTYYASSYRGTGTDAATGTLTSAPFTAGTQLLFRVNGGTDAANLKVSLLLQDDTEALTHTNNANTLELRSVTWDTTPWDGQQVRIRVTDNGTASWGHQGIDEVRVVYTPSGTTPATLGNGVLPFANASFEDRGYLNWFATGAAFGIRPVTNNDLGKEGGYYANSYNPTSTDTATGTLTSASFTAGRSLSFRINGGNKPGTAYAALVLPDGTEVLKTTHMASTRTLDPVTWDTSPYEGQTVRIRLVDNDTTSYGWIGADNFRILYGAALVQQVTDPAGRVHRYSYDPSGNLVAYTDPMDGTISYEYGPYGMIRGTDENGSVFVDNGYDVRGRVVEQLDAHGNLTTFSYDVANRTTTFTDQLGNSTVYSFDGSGRTVSVQDPLGKTESYGYDDNGNRIAVTDRNGSIVHYAYDAMGNVTWVTDPLGAVESYGYDAKNNPLSRTDALNRTTRFAYDTAGNLTRITDPLGGETAMAYDGLGQLVSSIDPLGNITGYGYDQNGNQTAITDPLGKTTLQQFDSVGRRLSATDPLSHTTGYGYDSGGRLTRVTDALGHTSGYGYDQAGNRTAVTDANGRTTSYGYDQADRLTQVTDAAAQVTSYGYDLVGRRTAVTDAMSRTTLYELDAVGRVTRETDPDNHSWQYSYTNTGNLLTRADANQANTGYAYDANGRLTAVTYPSGGVSHQYDAAGRRTSATNQVGTISYEYDALARLTRVTEPGGGSVGYGYDPAGNRTTITYPDGKVASYGYDEAGRLRWVTDWLGKVTSYSYDDAGRLASTSYPNGVVQTPSYNDANQLTGIVAAKDANIIASFSYTLDDAGMRTAVQTLAGTESYGYDSLYRLTAVTYPDATTQSYGYDAVGNRLNKVQNGATTEYGYDTAHRMTGAGGVSYGYDGNGNQTSRGTDSFTWDYENRLIGATIGGSSASFTYRTDGLRHSKTVGGSTTTYVWDVGTDLPVLLQDGTYTYLYGLGLISQTDAAGNQTYFLSDGLGSTAALTDADGNVVASYQYDAFGIIRNHSGPASTDFGFTGQQEDDALGYQYLRARYYDPAIGRFISKDPFPGTATNPASQHPYAYAHNSPVINTDPDGKFAVPVAVVAVAAFMWAYGVDIGLVAYDLGKLIGDNASGKCENTAENLANLGVDVISAFTPGSQAPILLGVRVSKNVTASTRVASSAFGRSTQSLMSSLASGKGPWQRVSAHGEIASSPVYRGGTSMEEVFMHQETGERIIRHTVWREGELLHETFRPYAKFGAD